MSVSPSADDPQAAAQSVPVGEAAPTVPPGDLVAWLQEACHVGAKADADVWERPDVRRAAETLLRCLVDRLHGIGHRPTNNYGGTNPPTEQQDGTISELEASS